MIPFAIKVPVRSEVVFPAGAMCMSVDPMTDFDRRGTVDDDQARDKETGERIWVITVVDLEEPDAATRFRKTAELKVRIVAAVRPVVPESRVPGYPPIVAFEGLTLAPYLDQSKCQGSRDKCRGRLAYALRATGMAPFVPAQ